MKILIGKDREGYLCIAERDTNYDWIEPVSTGTGFSLRKDSEIGIWILNKFNRGAFDEYGWLALDLEDDL